jgi:hypothetical protein
MVERTERDSGSNGMSLVVNGCGITMGFSVSNWKDIVAIKDYSRSKRVYNVRIYWPSGSAPNWDVCSTKVRAGIARNTSSNITWGCVGSVYGHQEHRGAVNHIWSFVWNNDPTTVKIVLTMSGSPFLSPAWGRGSWGGAPRWRSPAGGGRTGR